MKKKKLFMLVWDIDTNKGGLNQAMFTRSTAFSDKYDTTLLTLDYNKNYHKIEESLISTNRIPSNVKLLNIHDYYFNKFNTGIVSDQQVSAYKQESKLHEPGFQVQNNEYESKRYARYFKNGVYSKYKKWDKDGSLSHVDYFNEQRNRLSTIEFNKDGSIYKKTYYDLIHNKPIQDLYYTKEGTCYLIKWFTVGKDSVGKVYLLNSEKNFILFKSNNEFNQRWVEELIQHTRHKPIIICDGPGSSKVVSEIDSQLISKVMVIHSNHFAYPYRFGSNIKHNHINIFNHINDFDALTVLTEEQKSDIEKQFGHSEKINIIPHGIKNEETKKLEMPKKDTKLVSIVSRYHPEKRIDAAILAFNKVVKEIPDAKLDIHGDGIDKKRLKRIISENKLDDNVFLKGYTTDTAKVYKNSLFTLLTSEFEGFGLSLVESMQYYSPVIAFDVSYGPSEIIRNGINGFLVKDGDIEELSLRIIELLKNPKIALKMGQDAHKIVHERFSHQRYVQKWTSLLNSLP